MTDLVTKTLAPVRTEMSLHVLAYGLKRVNVWPRSDGRACS